MHDLDHLLGGRRAEVSQRTERGAAEGEGERKSKWADKIEGQRQFDIKDTLMGTFLIFYI